jgi:predicted 2-oxoglutarate/Fe(II)-dependent dioxygenase YbiX
MHELIALMDQVQTSGAFSVSGTLPSILPGLRVTGVGHIGLPLTEFQAKALIEHSEQAPYGRGEETIVDPQVRKCWQLSADDFELENPQWNEVLQVAVDQMGKELGLSDCHIGFEPYKLLVYEQGSFFAPHRDTEKIPNMFATLVVNLPSEHEGGELIISHVGQSQRYSFADSSLFEPSFVAFYADCYHEVKPLTSGYRLCLVYNLAITNRKKQPVLSERMGPIEEIDHAIQAWREEAHDKPILTYLLDHSYSEQNLSLANLKHGDFAKASVLLHAAAKSGCQAYLCLATYYRTSYGEVDSYGYGRRGRRGRYANYDDDVDESDFEEYDVSEELVYAHAFVGADGTKIDVKKLDLDEEDLLARVPLVDGPGRGYSISEATGNEGATKDLWYHRGAVIMWPKERELELVAKMDVDYGIHVLKRTIQDESQREGEHRQHLMQLANHLVETLPSYRSEDIAAALIQLEDIELLKTFLLKQAHAYAIDIDPDLLIQVAERFGWKPFAQAIQSRLTAQNGLQWLDALIQAGQSMSEEGQGVIRKWVTSRWQPWLTSAMQPVVEPARPSTARARHRYTYEMDRFHTEKRAKQNAIIDLVRLTSCLSMESVAGQVMKRLADPPEETFLTETYGPAIISALDSLTKKAHNEAIAQQFAVAVRACLQATYPHPPEPPKDWLREGELDCDCAFCTEVNAFLPKRDIGSMRIDQTLKRNLLHIDSAVEKSQVEVDIDIQKVASKFDGIIQKNQRRYERQQQLYDAAQEIMRQLPG